MEIQFKTTSEITKLEWGSYVDSFNEVFDKDFSLHHFEQKYKKTIDSESYHVFLLYQNKVVGACTNIPFEYLYQNKPIKIGLMVDVFILQDFRNDPLHLYRMYKFLRKEIIKKGIALVVAVPNNNSYSYWKNIVKWKDIGQLPYYAQLVNADKLISNLGGLVNLLLNPVNRFMIKSSYLFSTEEKISSIRINRNNEIIEVQRYFDYHQMVRENGAFFSYRIVTEGSTRTCYLIDFYNFRTNKKDTFSLRYAITKILDSENIDLMLFVGKLNFFQNILLRVPKKLEPKKLYFTYDLLLPEKMDEEIISDLDNWDFGLFNYDVR